MKYTFSNYKSYKKLIVDKTTKSTLEQLVRTGDILVPNGLGACNIELPGLANSHGLEVIKMARTDGGFRISINRGGGQLKGLVMALDENDNCRIFPIADNTRSVVFTDGLADGSSTKLLSDSNDWFMWTLGGRASGTTDPFVYQSPSNGGLATREAADDEEAESITGRGDGNGSGGSGNGPGSGGGGNGSGPETTPRPAPIGTAVVSVDLLTITSIVDENNVSYPIAGDTIAAASTTLTFTGTYHNDVQSITLSGQVPVTLGANNTWTHVVELSSLGRHRLVFRAFAQDASGSPYGPEEAVAVFTLDVEESTPHLLAYDLLEITHVNGTEWSDGDPVEAITIPSTITISGIYHEDVEGAIANGRSESGSLTFDTINKTWSYTETITTAETINFSFTASYEDDLETETVSIEFAEAVIEGEGEGEGEGGGGGGVGLTPDLFTITSTKDANNLDVQGSVISASEAITVSGDILVAGAVPSINGASVTVNGSTWSYAQTLTSTTTLDFSCIDPDNASNVDTESVTIALIDPTQVLEVPIAQNLPPLVVQPAATLAVTEDGDIQSVGDTFVFDNNNGGAFPTNEDLFTIEVLISMTGNMRVLDFIGTNSYIEVLGNKLVAGGTLFTANPEYADSSIINSGKTTLIDLTSQSIDLADGTTRRLVLVFDRRWSVGSTASDKKGSWRIHGAIGAPGGTTYHTDRFFYFPNIDGNVELLKTSINIGLGSFILKNLVILENVDFAPNQIEYAITNSVTIIEAMTSTTAQRITTPAHSGDNLVIAQPDFLDEGTTSLLNESYGIVNFLTSAKSYSPGMIHSLNDSYPTHAHGKTMAIGVQLHDEYPEVFPSDDWRCVISRFAWGSLGTTNQTRNQFRGWGLMLKHVSSTDTYSVAWVKQCRSAIGTDIDNNYAGLVAGRVDGLTLTNPNQLSFIIKSTLSEFRGYNSINVFLNNAATPILTFDVDNYSFSTNFGSEMELWDAGPAPSAAATETKLILGGLRDSSYAFDRIRLSITGVYSFFKIHYGITDSATDQQFLTDIATSFAAIPTLVVSDWAEENVDYADLTTLSLDANGVFVSSDQNTTSELATIPNYFAFKEWTTSIVNDCVSFSLWFKWDDVNATPPQILTLLESSWMQGFPFQIFVYDRYNDGEHSIVTKTTSNAIPIDEHYNELSRTLGINVLDGEWHHIFISRSQFQTSFISKGTYDYIVVDGVFESHYVPHGPFVDGNSTVETNANYEDFLLGSGAHAFSLDSIEMLNGTKLTFDQVKWLHDQGRGAGTIQSASNQTTSDLYSAGTYTKHTSLFTSDLIDDSSIVPDLDGNYSNINVAIKDVNFRWENAQGWPGKAYSFWVKCKDVTITGNQTIFQLFYGNIVWEDWRGGDLQNGDVFGIKMETTSNLTVIETRTQAARERTGSSNSWAGMGLHGVSAAITEIADGEMVHFLMTVKKLSDGSVETKTFMNGVEISTANHASNKQFAIKNGRNGVLTTGANFDINGDIEVLLGEFDAAQAITIYNDASTANTYAASFTP